MPPVPPGAIDCDLHPALPSTKALLPYMDEYWREHILRRGLEAENFELSAYPASAPINARPDWQGGTLDAVRTHILGPMQPRYAICNTLHGGMVMYSEDLSAALCRAVNNWMAAEWLDKDPRLRASIVIPVHSPDLAAAEIDRMAPDRRFVQILMLAMTEMPLGRRQNWPIYEAATRHNLPIGVHAGSSQRHPPSATGWPSYYLEDYVTQSQGFAAVLNSLVAEGVFTKFPTLKVVLIESGVTCLPACLWRMDKTWRGVRSEVPWVDRRPTELIRDHVRLTLQPFDEPPNAAQVETILAGIGGEHMLLFSSDYPHWHYDGDDAIPAGLPPALVQKILVDNPLETYPRLS